MSQGSTQPSRVSQEAVEKFQRALDGKLDGKLVSSASVCAQHSKDESRHPSSLPDLVAFPAHTADVATLVRTASELRVPVVPFGTGTGLEGGAIPIRGGLSINFSEMKKVLAVHPEDFDVCVQPGLTHRSLNNDLRTQGVFFPVDPGADASLGGMAATRASGTNAVRYGTMRENVLALEVVLADGRIVRTGRRTRKSAAGYDLTRLFIGSEGTLGIITELTLRIYGIPETIASAVCAFDTLEGAVRTVIATIQAGIPMARIEILDDVQVDAVNRYSKLSLPVKDMLFLEFHGSPTEVEAQTAAVQLIASEWGGAGFEWKSKAEERNQLWRARHDVAWSCKALRPGCSFISTDVCVPISRLAECILETKKDVAASSLIAPIVGHVGDGNFHLTILVNTEDDAEMREGEQLNERLVRRALAMDGTCTGEHGVGLGKRKFLKEEHASGLEVMHAIKATLDPHGILNPGKILYS